MIASTFGTEQPTRPATGAKSEGRAVTGLAVLVAAAMALLLAMGAAASGDQPADGAMGSVEWGTPQAGT